MIRTIKVIETSMKTMEGAGFPVYRPVRIPDPFLLFDEFGPIQYAPGQAKGAPNHPHRGFITVGYMLSGEIKHKDSMGNSGVLRAGDVQFMTAGSGVIHDESPTKKMLKDGGLMHGFQIWINLPSKLKMMDPEYQDVPSVTIPVVDLKDENIKPRKQNNRDDDDNNNTTSSDNDDGDNKNREDNIIGTAKVVSGEAFGVVGPVITRTPIIYIDFTLNPHSSIQYSIPSNYNVMVYIIEGEGVFGSERRVAKAHQAVVFNNNAEAILMQTLNHSVRFLLLAAIPLNEPIARHGPFVMNTREEIAEAYQEFYTGTFVKAKANSIKALKSNSASDTATDNVDNVDA